MFLQAFTAEHTTKQIRVWPFNRINQWSATRNSQRPITPCVITNMHRSP